MFKRILLALALLQAAFLLAGILFYERFYWEVNLVRGLVVLTPLLGAGLGGALAYFLGRQDRKRALTIWGVCLLAAAPAFFVSQTAGQVAWEFRQDRLQAERLKEPERRLRALAAARGWALGEYDLNPTSAYLLYGREGKRYLGQVRLEPETQVIGTIGLADLEAAFAGALGWKSVQLEPAHLLSRKFTARTGEGGEYAVVVIPGHEKPEWRLRCVQTECPSQQEIILPMRPD